MFSVSSIPSIPLFTNAVGTHTITSIGEVHDRGQFFGRPPYDNVSYYSYPSEISIKPPHHPGDGHNAYNYLRSGAKVTKNRPMVSRHFDVHHEPDGTASYNWNYTHEIAIPQVHSTFGYRVQSPESGNSHNQSIVLALNDLSNGTQLGSDLGESHQTFDQFANLAHRLANLILALKARRWKDAYEAIGYSKHGFRRGRRLADDWLQYQYGWKPLMSSLYDTAEVLRNAVPMDNYIRGKGRGSFDDSREFTNESIAWKESIVGGHRTVIVGQKIVEGLAQAQNLGLINPLSIAWELMPFSFMIDWFVPVGQVLSSMTSVLGLRFVGGYTSYREFTTLSGSRRSDINWDLGRSEPLDPGAYEEVSFAMQRTAFSNFPFPEGFYASTNPYRTTRALNALAIARQLV